MIKYQHENYDIGENETSSNESQIHQLFKTFTFGTDEEVISVIAMLSLRIKQLQFTDFLQYCDEDFFLRVLDILNHGSQQLQLSCLIFFSSLTYLSALSSNAENSFPHSCSETISSILLILEKDIRRTTTSENKLFHSCLIYSFLNIAREFESTLLRIIVSCFTAKLDLLQKVPDQPWVEMETLYALECIGHSKSTLPFLARRQCLAPTLFLTTRNNPSIKYRASHFLRVLVDVKELAITEIKEEIKERRRIKDSTSKSKQNLQKEQDERVWISDFCENSLFAGVMLMQQSHQMLQNINKADQLALKDDSDTEDYTSLQNAIVNEKLTATEENDFMSMVEDGLCITRSLCTWSIYGAQYLYSNPLIFRCICLLLRGAFSARWRVICVSLILLLITSGSVKRVQEMGSLGLFELLMEKIIGEQCVETDWTSSRWNNRITNDNVVIEEIDKKKAESPRRKSTEREKENELFSSPTVTQLRELEQLNKVNCCIRETDSLTIELSINCFSTLFRLMKGNSALSARNFLRMILERFESEGCFDALYGLFHHPDTSIALEAKKFIVQIHSMKKL